MQFKNTMGFVAALVASQVALSQFRPGGESQLISLNLPTQEISAYKTFCLGKAVYQAANRRLERAEKIKINFTAESVTLSHGNMLRLRDLSGRDLPYLNLLVNSSYDRQGQLELPYIPASRSILVPRTNDDICMSSTDLGRISSVTVTLSDFGGGDHHDGPGDHHLTDPLPPPRPRVQGELATITETGDVMGWACEVTSRRSLQVRVYVNGDRSPYTGEASMNTQGERGMGRPSLECGPVSGYRVHIPLERYAGNNVNIEARGVTSFGEEVSLGSRTIFAPLLRVPRGLFSVTGRNEVYYSDGDRSFCYVTTPDQMTLYKATGAGNLMKVSGMPREMRQTGDCQWPRMPKGFFTAKSENEQKVFYAEGNSFCLVMDMGQYDHIHDKKNVPAQQMRLENLPPANVSQSTGGICKVEGFFRLGGDVYYSNGNDAFCRAVRPSQYEGAKVYNYNGKPSNLRDDGDCQYH